MIRRLAIVLGWMAALIIVFATLSPIGSGQGRVIPTRIASPRSTSPTHASPSAILATAGRVSLGVVMGSALLEAGQLLVTGRDAHVHDAAVEIVGGVAGLTLAALGEHFVSRSRATIARD